MAVQRPQGTLRWFGSSYGHIQLDGFPPYANEVFVHATAFDHAGLRPRVGMRISFDVGPGSPPKNPNPKNRHRVVAINLSPLI
jgi:cold shock CspA family protein